MSKESDEELKKVTFLFDVIKRYDHYIGTINVKAGLLFSFIVVVMWNITKNSADLPPSCTSNLLIIFSIVIIISGVISTYNLLSSIFPNFSSSSYKRSLIYYGDVCKKYADKNEYIKEIHAVSTKDILEDLASQAYDLSTILLEKFSKQKLAVYWLKYAMLPSLFAYILIMLLVGKV